MIILKKITEKRALKLIKVFVTTNSKKEFVEEKGGKFFVSVSAKPKEGRANARVKEILAKHFNVLSKKIVLQKGRTERGKWFIVYDWN